MDNVSKIIAGTFTIIVVYYFVVKADESSKLIKAISSAYSDSVKTLMARN